MKDNVEKLYIKKLPGDLEIINKLIYILKNNDKLADGLREYIVNTDTFIKNKNLKKQKSK